MADIHSPNQSTDDDFDNVEEKLRQEEKEKHKKPMPESGRSVFDIQRLLEDKDDNEAPGE